MGILLIKYEVRLLLLFLINLDDYLLASLGVLFILSTLIFQYPK
jgi:hypothetical protein